VSKAGIVVDDRRLKHWDESVEREHAPHDPLTKYKEIDVTSAMQSFPLIPYPGRVYVVQAEVEMTSGGLYIPASAVKEGEMQTNFGWVVATGDGVVFCKPGDKIFYGRYSGSWVMDMQYRVMNEDDILGKFKEEM